jgi:hypothetical protein
MKQGPALDETRAVLQVFLPDSWFTGNNSENVTGLRTFAVVVAVCVFVVTTAVRRSLTRAAAAAGEESASWAVLGLTALRTLVLLEAAVLFVGASGITDPSVVGEGGVGPAWTWPWFLTAVLPWLVLAFGVLGGSFLSAERALTRAHRIERRRNG